MDYWKLNQDTIRDRYPMPRVDELVNAVGYIKRRYFSIYIGHDEGILSGKDG